MLPLVFIPGIQGRWEYLRPAIEALAHKTLPTWTFQAHPEAVAGRQDQFALHLDGQLLPGPQHALAPVEP